MCRVLSVCISWSILKGGKSEIRRVFLIGHQKKKRNVFFFCHQYLNPNIFFRQLKEEIVLVIYLLQKKSSNIEKKVLPTTIIFRHKNQFSLFIFKIINILDNIKNELIWVSCVTSVWWIWENTFKIHSVIPLLNLRKIILKSV